MKHCHVFYRMKVLKSLIEETKLCPHFIIVKSFLNFISLLKVVFIFDLILRAIPELGKEI
jgi:hypothetical protein